MRDSGYPALWLGHQAVRKTLPHRGTQMVQGSGFMVKGYFSHEFLTLAALDVLAWASDQSISSENVNLLKVSLEKNTISDYFFMHYQEFEN